MSKPRLTKAKKQAIVEAVLAGEIQTKIAARFGVDASYPHIITRRYLKRGVVKRKGEELRA